MTIKETNEKFLSGKALTDGELHGLLHHYKQLSEYVNDLGDDSFSLFLAELQSRYSDLYNFDLHRKP